MTPGLRYNLWDGHSQLLLYLSRQWGVDLVSLWPSFIRPTISGYVWAACAIFLVGALGLWFNGTLPLQAQRAGSAPRLTGEGRQRASIATRAAVQSRAP
jgi:hypothetical protein